MHRQVQARRRFPAARHAQQDNIGFIKTTGTESIVVSKGKIECVYTAFVDIGVADTVACARPYAKIRGQAPLQVAQ